MKKASLVFGCCLLLTMLLSTAVAQSQTLDPRFGFGFNMLLSSEDGIGLGLRGRASAPINADLSFGVDLGFTGFVLEGRDDASYLFDPQVSAIVTLPGIRTAPYFIGGLGAHIPLDDDDSQAESGPTIHLGVGWVRALSETTIFYEINPALIIGQENVSIALPFRVGVIL